MAHIVVFTHEYDAFSQLRWPLSPAAGGFLLSRILRRAETMGHTWRAVRGARPCPGDVALLHVDATVVAPEYLDLAAGFSRALNFDTVDLSKRKVSDAVVSPDSDWSGPVIIKSDLNFSGYRECEHNRMAARRGAPPPHPGATFTPAFTVLNHIGEVPDTVWRDPSRVVERFVPETAPEGYAMRVWLFMGARERCMRHVSSSPIIKGANTLRIEHVEAPPALREKRRRLGFDYGKLDYVEHDGEVILIDANRTPGAPPREVDANAVHDFAVGLHELISD